MRPELAAVIGAERFLAEIKVTANLQHPHIVTLIDSGESDGTLWYVLPYIRGESLRDRLTRERQLGVDDALAITRQVAAALDYAHAQGVIHRDIKPENILLHEGEAMLADFGIALAVKQAGGNRLTETGLSLGTPQYMSPEQATADRALDARSDVYSLGAVLYEMLAGEPPHTGATAHAVIAKLLTERPLSLRVVRSSLPPGVDAAVSRALETVAADRFPTAGEFARALDAARAAAPQVATVGTRRRAVVIGVAAGVLVVAAVGWIVWRSHRRDSAAPSFNARTQVTFTGNAARPALSADGTQIAYVVHDCTSSGCQDAIDIQDVDGSAKRRLVDGVSAIDFLNWSPDRRFLLFVQTHGSKIGIFLVSTLGGAPRRVGSDSSSFAFLWSGDSLVETAGDFADTVGWLKTRPFDGEARDSIRLHGLKGGGYAMAFPGDQWLLLAGEGRHGQEARIVDRQGQQRDVFIGGRQGFQIGGSAAWSWVPLGGSRQGIVRLPVDLGTGKFRLPPDTVLNAASDFFDVSADGSTIAYVEGGRQYDMWVLPLAEAMQGRFSPERHIFGSTSQLGGALSPDGRQLLVEHSEAGSAGSRVVMSILPTTGGSGVDFNSPGNSLAAGWSEDGAWIIHESRSATGIQFVLIDPRTGQQARSFATGDTAYTSYDALAGGGWVWIPPSHDRVRFQRKQGEKPVDFPLPAGKRVFNVNASPNGTRLVAFASIPSTDSVILSAISLPGGQATRWITLNGPVLDARWLSNGSLMAEVRESGSITLYRVTAPDHAKRLGTIPRATLVSWSYDGRQVGVITSEVRGNVWLARSSGRRP